MDELTTTKDISDNVELYDTTPNVFMTSDFLRYLISTNNLLPGWWTNERDIRLRQEVIKNGFLASAVNVVLLKLAGLPFSIQSRDSAVGAHIKLAEIYNSILQVSLNQCLEQFIKDILECDNGGFLYVLGDAPSDLPLLSIPAGLKHLDSTRITRTGNIDYPFLYQNIHGTYYKLHWSRVINITQMPSSDVEMFGVGLSFVSRCFILAQHLLDVANYESESLGSRSAEELIYATAVSSGMEVKKAFNEAEVDSTNAGLMRVGKRVFIGLRDPNAKIGKLMLKNTPEYFDKREDVEITLTLLAMASGGQSTWFYDSVKSGSTKASAQEATKMGESKLINWYLKRLTDELELKFCPDSLRVVAGLADDDFDGTKARIRLNAAQTRALNLTNNVTNVRTERELQLQRGELTKSQFEQLELSDGRLENGLPIFAIFQTDEALLQTLLYFVDDPLDFSTINWDDDMPKLRKALLNAQGQALNGKTILTQNNGRKAFYALLWLEQQYKDFLAQNPELIESQTVLVINSSPNLNNLTNNATQVATPQDEEEETNEQSNSDESPTDVEEPQ